MTPTKFYRVLADPNILTNWFLKAPIFEDGTVIDARLFTKGEVFIEDKTLIVPLRRHGKHVDFNLGDFDMVITKKNINEKIFSQFKLKAQRIPVIIEGLKNDFEILNVLDLIACVDEVNSEFDKWTEMDGRPDKVGKFRMFTHLCIDEKKAEGHHLFRLAEWPIVLVVSNELKVFLEKIEVNGIVFKSLSKKLNNN